MVGGGGGVVGGGSVTTVLDGGTKMDDVGGGWVVVVSGGASVVAVVVATGGDVWGGLVPVLRGWVVATGGWVVAVVTPVPAAGAAVVVAVSGGVEVEDDVEVGMTIVFSGRRVVRPTVVEGACVATCCLGDVSLPVATSNRRAAKAMEARAYSPTLKR
jgi:hypothetical protein